ncbi:hypothetical protein BS78_K287400 [Paspalum vaginatum]|uniref:Protein kinase domain-containing protein n=1 Tax=Paspalum vaginatum TaxID=158149 RepID=A0A9W7XDB7_9POAL|nr:hypothetical protein BS78_K287400 [Paspalum vaginatum]
MAASAVSSSDAHPLLVLVFLISTCLLLPLSQAATTINSAAVLTPFYFSFDFTNQSSYNSDDLRFEGNATVRGNLIDLSCNSRDQNIDYCVGRVLYSRPVPLYDDTTLASFSTSFTFVIRPDNNNTMADGIAFFLSGYPSSLPLGDSSGGSLGLIVDRSYVSHLECQKVTIIVGGVLALLLLVVVAWFILSCWKWRNRHPDFKKHETTRFEYRDLAAATDHFSEEKKLGEGYFGVVYRGNLKKSGRENLVKLVGWCRGNRWNFFEFMCWCWNNENNNKMFLVYELVPKGSLHDHLHKEEILPWEIRYNVVKGITCALVYLHHECDPLILHRDIKPSNILLDNNFNAKIADFGLSRIVNPDSSWVLTLPVGTMGYLDPQCMKSVGMVEFNRSSDVYSYGIVVLEIACRKGMTREKVWQQYLNRSLMQAADDKLKGEFRRSEMENVIILGLWCSFPDSKKRPSMLQVMAVLEHVHLVRIDVETSKRVYN